METQQLVKQKQGIQSKLQCKRRNTTAPQKKAKVKNYIKTNKQKEEGKGKKWVKDEEERQL